MIKRHLSIEKSLNYYYNFFSDFLILNKAYIIYIIYGISVFIDSL